MPIVLTNVNLLCSLGWSEVGAFYWPDLAPDIVNSGREEQGAISA